MDMRQKLLFLFVVAALLLAPAPGHAVDGYSNRCDWCVTAGFWENVIRGNDKCLEYVSDELREEAVRMSATFRTKMTKKCGQSYHDGHIESTFSYQRLGPQADGTSQVRVYGESHDHLSRQKAVFKRGFRGQQSSQEKHQRPLGSRSDRVSTTMIPVP